MAAVAYDNVCSICLSELGRKTKTLPCKHRFCSSCIVKYIDQQLSQTFTCPNCRKVIKKDFQLLECSSLRENVEVNSADSLLELKLSDFFCVSCDTPIYRDDIRLHDKHLTECSKTVASRKRQSLAIAHTKLEMEVRKALDDVQTVNTQAEATKKKLSAVENAINERYEAVVRVAKRSRERALQGLRENNKSASFKNEDNVNKQQERLSELLCVRQQMEEALKPENDCETYNMSKWMNSKSSQRLLESTEQITFDFPVLCGDFSWDNIQENVGAFIGMAQTAAIIHQTPEMRPKMKLDRKIINESFWEILTICDADEDGTVAGVVAIAYSGDNGKKQVVKVSDSGEVTLLKDDIRVKDYQHIKRMDNGRLLQPAPTPDVVSTYSKSTRGTHFRLNSGYNGKGEIRRVQMVSSSPLLVKGKTVLKVTGGPHRAFDVSKNGKNFIVLEEAEALGKSCTVLMFTKKSSHPVTTYQPPCQPFRPTDICFYQLGGQEVLLVADEASDTIHVVDVQEYRLVFLRHLALGTCMLFQPMNLHVDPFNRLWVACRAGDVFALEPSDSTTTTKDRETGSRATPITYRCSRCCGSCFC